MNSEHNKTSHSHGFLLNLTDKTDLRRGEKSISLSNLSICYKWKEIKKKHRITINFKYHLYRGILSILKKTWRKD